MDKYKDEFIHYFILFYSIKISKDFYFLNMELLFYLNEDIRTGNKNLFLFFFFYINNARDVFSKFFESNGHHTVLDINKIYILLSLLLCIFLTLLVIFIEYLILLCLVFFHSFWYLFFKIEIYFVSNLNKRSNFFCMAAACVSML